MTMRLPTLLLALAAVLLCRCSHHEGHHARGEEHWHHAPEVHNVHGADDEHRQDSDPDTFHTH